MTDDKFERPMLTEWGSRGNSDWHDRSIAGSDGDDVRVQVVQGVGSRAVWLIWGRYAHLLASGNAPTLEAAKAAVDAACLRWYRLPAEVRRG